MLLAHTFSTLRCSSASLVAQQCIFYNVVCPVSDKDPIITDAFHLRVNQWFLKAYSVNIVFLSQVIIVLLIIPTVGLLLMLMLHIALKVLHSFVKTFTSPLLFNHIQCSALPHFIWKRFQFKQIHMQNMCRVDLQILKRIQCDYFEDRSTQISTV